MSQVDLDEAIAHAAGFILAPDWLLARARRHIAVEVADVSALGLSYRPLRHVYVCATMQELRKAAGLDSGQLMPRPGEGVAHAGPEETP